MTTPDQALTREQVEELCDMRVRREGGVRAILLAILDHDAALRETIALKDKIIAGCVADEGDLERAMEQFGMAFTDDHGWLHPEAVITKFINALRDQLDQSMRVQEQLAENVNTGLLEIRSLKQQRAHDLRDWADRYKGPMTPEEAT